MKIPKKEWLLFVERRYLPFSISLNMYICNKKELHKVVPIQMRDYFAIFKDGCYFPVEMPKSASEYQIKEFEKQGAKFLEGVAKKCIKKGSELIDVVKRLSVLKLSNLDNKKLVSLFLQSHKEYREFSVFLLLPLSLEKFFDEQVRKIVEKGSIDEKKRVEYHQKLVAPIRYNVSQEENISLLEIASNIEKKGLKNLFEKETTAIINELREKENTIWTDILIHLEKYSWLQTRWFYGKLLSAEDIVERLKTTVEENPSEKLKEMKENPLKVKKETKKIFQELNCTKEEKAFINVVKEYVFLRTYRTDKLNEANYHLMPLLHEAAKRLNIPYDDLLYLTLPEVVESLQKNSISSSINIAQRKKSWALFREGEEVVVFQGEKEVEEFGKQQGFAGQDFSKIREVKGNKAFGGKVTGTAKVILSPAEVGKVQKGDILIAVMTFPSFIVAMEKAAAFVTDEGGILCHAAIVAREMKKPCVIATKIATKVFKDGDLVEVDADKGVVKKLK